MALFGFELTPVDQVMPWGHPGAEELHWFALTDGQFWIEGTPGGAIGFYVAQIWESLLDVYHDLDAGPQRLNLRFLENEPSLEFAAHGATVELSWPGGSLNIPRPLFNAEVRDFHERFFSAMEPRAPFGGPRFAAEQLLRRSWLASEVNSPG